MSRTAVLATFVFVVAGLSGCASPARVIRQDSTSVVVAIPDNTNSWPFYYQDEAKHAAGTFIQDPVLVTSRREKVGEQTTNSAEARQRSFGEVMSSTTSVSDKYEYHLEYRSNGPVHGPSTITGSGSSASGGPAASLSPRGAPDGADPVRPVIPPLLPVTPPTSPATNMPNTALPGPGR